MLYCHFFSVYKERIKLKMETAIRKVSIIPQSNPFGKHYDDQVYTMIKKYCLTQELISHICWIAIKARNISIEYIN
jgi:hypothetical protein